MYAARMDSDKMTWRDDVRLGWLVSRYYDENGLLYGVRKDGKVVEGHTAETVLGRMMAADVARTWRRAFG